MKKIISLFLFLFSLLIQNSYAQMPPHPRLLEEIQKGIKPTPYFLKNIDAVRGMGVDASWSSKELNLLREFKKTPRIFGSSLSPTGSWKALLILVQFSDKPKQVDGLFFNDLLFGDSQGTLKDFYNKISFGNLDIVTVNLPSSIGWQNAPQTYAYYCNGQNGLGNYPQNSQKLVEDIVNEVDPVVDFSQYDNDHDGYVDALFIVHTGPGAELTGYNNDIWSHAWGTYTEQVLDGVKVLRYSIEPEYWQIPGDMTIGVFAHELGHSAFGLPDLYDIDYTSSGLGNWSLMAGGSWNGPTQLGNFPSMPDAYCRIQMGFVSPAVITTNLTNKSIPNIEDSPVIYKLWKNGEASSQYFLVENRQQISFDQYLPNSGLLIYHIDESVTTENKNEWYPEHTSNGNYLVALEEADGLYHLEKNINRGDAGDSYPGSANNLNFSNFSFPDSKDYNFTATGVGVKNISPSTLTMYADLQIVETEKTINLLSPNGGEKWSIGTTKDILWTSSAINSIKIEYSLDNGSNWIQIVASTSAETGNFQWTLPNNISNQCKIKISDAENVLFYDESDDLFTIKNSVFNIDELMQDAKFLLVVETNTNVNINAILNDNLNSEITSQDGFVFWDKLLNDYNRVPVDQYGGIAGLTTSVIIRTAINSSGKIFIGSFGDNLAEQLSLFTGKENGIENYIDFDWNLLNNYDYETPEDIFVSNSIKQNRLSYILRQEYISLNKSGYLSNGLTNGNGLFNCSFSLKNNTNYKIIVLKSFICHQQFDYSWYNSLGRPADQKRNQFWSPIANNPDQNIGLLRSFNITYVNPIYSSILIETGTDNNMAGSVRITGLNNPPDYTASGGDYRNWSILYDAANSAYQINNQNCANAALNLFNQYPNFVSMWGNTTWSGYNQQIFIAMMGDDIITTNHIEQPSPGDDNNPLPMKLVINPGWNYDHPTHFVKNWNNPYLPMNFYITSATINSTTLNTGDEVALFDGDNCVGMGLLTGQISPGGYLSIIASTNDPTTPEVDGFISGNDINFKYWYNKKLSEVNSVAANYSVGEGNFSSLGSVTVSLTGAYKITQELNLKSGWNIFSLITEQENPNMLQLLDPLITSGKLVKVQDENGNAVEQLPIIGWINNIGNWSTTEGYYLKVNSVSTLSLNDRPVQLPMDIPIKGAWNIISYPVSSEKDAIAILQPLITANQLIKVQDDEGNAIEQLPAIGWINNIGNFKSGEGYYLKANSNTTLTFVEALSPNVTKNIQLKENSLSDIKTHHFVPVYSSPYLPMNLYVTGVDLPAGGTLDAGDEIGIFDGDRCVGAIELAGPITNYIALIASTDDPTTGEVDGFTSGHSISYKFWLSSTSTETSEYSVNYTSGDGTFASLGTAVFNFTNVLPVELYLFTANVVKNLINLNWKTATEVSNYGFEIERKLAKESAVWAKIGFIKGNGNSNSTKEYYFVDKNLYGGNNFCYRLKQIDINGSFSYSKEIEVTAAPDKYDLSQNYPNPFNPITNIEFQILNKGLVTLKIYDVLGNEVYTIFNGELDAGFYKYQWNANSFSSGVYFYRLQSGNFLSTKKLLLIK